MKKHYLELDALRGLAIIGVILIHITSNLADNGEVIGIFVNQVSRFAVPIFLILSGLGLTLSNKIEVGYLQFLWGQLLKILPLYFIWSLIYYSISTESFSFGNFLLNLIVGTNYYHLYYVPIIVLLYIIYPVLLKISKSIWCLIIILLATIFSQYADIITGLEIFNLPQNIFNWLFYFSFGIFLAKDFDILINKIKKYKTFNLISLLLSMIILLLESIYLKEVTTMRPTIILYSIFFVLVILSQKWESIGSKGLILKLSGFSYGMYLSHAMVLDLWEIFYYNLEVSMDPITYMIVAFLTVIFISIIVTILVDKVLLFTKTSLYQLRYKYGS